ncbi:hypothetical protein ETB97_011436 [Aspergillus alliaceus]|uniref:Uncharacterized protein n=1 Tax=Petromyces alliaceus TaxID=209559 RepID=A0A8H6EBJ9_PETAA|nr:hypothetical protein ETB97_011436 [Aspergillus burnettii]
MRLTPSGYPRFKTVTMLHLTVCFLLAFATAAPVAHDPAHGSVQARSPTNIYPGVGLAGDEADAHVKLGLAGEENDHAKRTNIYPGVGLAGEENEHAKRTNIYPGVGLAGESEE